MLDTTVRAALLVGIHRSVEEAASAMLTSITDPSCKPEVLYPPNEELSTAERDALKELRLSAPARSGLRKLLKSAMATCFHDFFCIVDGVGDPPQQLLGKQVYSEYWPGISLSLKQEDEEFLHDELFESFWAYKKAYPSES